MNDVSAPALSVQAVSHSFGDLRAVDDVSFDVAAGRFTALLGVNGAGKSTLFNLITRLYSYRAGRIVVCGHDMQAAPRRALASLGVVFQSRSLDNALSAAENIIFQAALHGIGRREALRRGEAALGRVGLADLMGRKVGALSGGQARRVEIARAMLHRPRLLLCDEATVGLDVKSRADIVADMHGLAAEEGVGVLWATHLVDEIWPHDQVVILHKGKVLADSTAAEVAGGGGLSDAFLAMTAGGS